MRRLIYWIYATVLGLQVRSNDQHITDLQDHLFELTQARQKLDEQIDSAMAQLLDATARRDALAKRSLEPFVGRRVTDHLATQPGRKPS